MTLLPRSLISLLIVLVSSLLGVVVFFDATTWTHAQEEVKLNRYSSRYYTVYSNLSPDQVRPLTEHMDEVFAEYDRRFSAFRPRNRKPMDLYLFRQEDEYRRFLSRHGLNADNSGGMFFVQAKIQGLATWVEGKNRSDIFEILQHEGFHQFAFTYLGTSLPTWLNEGLAQYYEDGILVYGKTAGGAVRMHLGMANPNRFKSVQAAMQDGSIIDFDVMLRMNDQEWTRTLAQDRQRASLLYDQAWSVVHFLIHADNGKYRKAFEDFLGLLSKGQGVDSAFAKAFGSSDTAPFRKRWEEYMRQIRADDLSVTVMRMEFLGQAMLFLMEKQREPKDISQLRHTLRSMQYYATRTRNNVTIRFNATDDDFYEYPRPGNRPLPIAVIPSGQKSVPAGLTAPELSPQPTLIWQRNGQGKWLHEVVFR